MNSRPCTGARVRWGTLFVAWGLFGVLWSFSTGLGGSPDEPAHMVKAVAVADLQFNTDVTRVAGGLGSSIPLTNVRVPAAYALLSGTKGCWVGKLDVPASCMAGLEKTTMSDANTYVGAYPPTYYMAVGWPSRLLSPPRAMYAMRGVSALLSAAFLAEGTFHLVRRRTNPLMVAAGALAIPVTVLFLTSSVNPNGLEVAAAFCLWATVIGVHDGPDHFRRRELAATAAAAIVLTWVRPLGPAYTLLIAVIALGTLAPAQRVLNALRSSRAAQAIGAALGASILLAVGFALVNQSFSSLITYGWMGERDSGTVASEALGKLHEYLYRSWGLLGWEGVQRLTVPQWITLTWLGLIACLAVVALLVGTARQRFGLAVLILGSLVGPVVSSVASPDAPWQGRYMLPLLIGIPLLSGEIVTRSATIDSWRIPRMIPLGVVVFCAVGYLVAHQRLMNRTVVGLPSPPLASLSEGTWNGPLNPVALFVWAVVASAFWGFLMHRLIDRRDEETAVGRPVPDALEPAGPRQRRSSEGSTINDAGVNREA